MSEENKDFKEFLLSELKELGYRENTEGLSVEGLKLAVQFQKKLNNKSKKEPGTPKPSIGPIDMTRENAFSFASDIQKLIELTEDPIDPRSLEDERFKRDNKCIKYSSNPLECWILRDGEGRCT